MFKSIYPLDWNPNDINSFNNWAIHIHSQLRAHSPSQINKVNRKLKVLTNNHVTNGVG